MLKLLQKLKELLATRRSKASCSHLLGMYLQENNPQGKQMRKQNRERA